MAVASCGSRALVIGDTGNERHLYTYSKFSSSEVESWDNCEFLYYAQLITFILLVVHFVLSLLCFQTP